ncbi:hypothetical protein PPERSA_01930 [Pseudocohnilembus persalinus]|uniref:Peptidase M54, archaemetzincin n=1 Tax=Pseudocohnilembus persalinus TaxID=266149 RepID=A0A0V0R3G0_PSEPJ|nr:hypothetical protein PPERSA_01930 [Pseudocohnilembus persalinus]|eukprot:KRX09043.1 hypothetical protein PPERSA_01930 [Pseudocohnilembus persalinus]
MSINRFLDIQNENIFQDLNENQYNIILLRTAKTIVHEISHIFGLKHCGYYECVMKGSNHLQESDNKPIQMCPNCLRKLQHQINFDIKKRYQQIISYMKEKKIFQNDFQVYQQILQKI